MRLLVLTTCFSFAIQHFCNAQPHVIQNHSGSGDNVINKYVLYKKIIKITKNDQDRSLLYLGFKIADSKSDSTQPLEVLARYEELYSLCINSVRDNTFFINNKSKIINLLDFIYRQNSNYFKDTIINRANKEYDELRKSPRAIITKHYSYGAYEGTFADGQQNGIGKFTWENGDWYVGQFKNNLIEGFGIWKEIGYTLYIGSLKRGNREGYGIYLFNNGDVYEGEFKGNKMNGVGKYTYSNGDFFLASLIMENLVIKDCLVG